MVIAYHLILCSYGFWLPNDPRGSWSDFIGSWEILKFGKPTTVTTHASLAHVEHDWQARLAAKKALKYPAVLFNGAQARAIARGIARFVKDNGIIVLACSIMPDHIHLVIARHSYQIEQIANLLKGAATRQLNEENIHPVAKFAKAGETPPKAFARGQLAVFLEAPQM